MRAGHAKKGAHSKLKLTASDVREIRTLLATTSQQEIAERFGVHQTTISRIKLGESWGHLDA